MRGFSWVLHKRYDPIALNISYNFSIMTLCLESVDYGQLLAYSTLKSVQGVIVERGEDGMSIYKEYLFEVSLSEALKSLMGLGERKLRIVRDDSFTSAVVSGQIIVTRFEFKRCLTRLESLHLKAILRGWRYSTSRCDDAVLVLEKELNFAMSIDAMIWRICDQIAFLPLSSVNFDIKKSSDIKQIHI